MRRNSKDLSSPAGAPSAADANGNNGNGKRVSIASLPDVGSDVYAPSTAGGRSRESSVASVLVVQPRTARDMQITMRQTAKEQREEARRMAIEERQHQALVMLRNIPVVECRITCAQSVRDGSGFGSKRYTVYQIELSVPKDVYKASSHTVMRRYSKFANLHEGLHRAWGRQVELPPLPSKKYKLIGGLSSRQIEERREGLEAYIMQLLQKLNWAVEPNIRAFLECDRWVKERRTRPMSQ